MTDTGLGDAVEVIRAPGLADVPHGFLGRRGGVSQGIVAGLNVGHGAGDDAEAVAENRRRAVAAVLPGAALTTVYQVHSADAMTVVRAWVHDQRPPADAMATDRPGILLGIVTADCAPVLLADTATGVIGAAHAGWRGAHAGVLEAVVGEMAGLGAERERIVAAIGPAIAQPSYEVDHAFRRQFGDADEPFFAPGRPGHWQFDLEGYAAARLARAGVTKIARLGLDTYPDAARFYSYRRATHLGEPGYGRQISLIGLPP